MKTSLITISSLIFIVFGNSVFAQQRKTLPTTKTRPASSQKINEIGQNAVVMDETLSVLREKPSLFSPSIQRMRRGRAVQILGVSEADGVKFYRVTAPPKNYGWVQADAVFGKFRSADESRLADLVRASEGFDQIELTVEFFTLYPNSKFRPLILLLYGDLLEDIAAKLSKTATSQLKRPEMAASAAPLHSYYLNYVSLDRYRKLGIIFLFNPTTKLFHYNGASWAEIVKKKVGSSEASEAQKRLDSLKIKMEKTAMK